MVRSPSRRLAPALLPALLLAATAAPARQEAAAASPAPIPVAVLAVPFPIADAHDAQVPLLVELGGAALLAGQTQGEVAGEIRATAVDAGGRTVEEIVQPFVLDAADERLQRGLQLFAMMRLPAGAYRLSTTVSNSTSGGVGRWEGGLTVPDFSAGQLTVSPPLFPQSPERLRVFRQSESPHEGLPYPFEGVGGEAFLPAASAVTGGDGAAFNVFLYGAGGLPQRFQARLVGAAGNAVDVPVEVLGMAAGQLPGQRKLALRLQGPLPPPGSYRLELAIGTSGGSGTTAAALAVLAEAPPAPEPLGLAPRATAAAADEPAVLPRDWTPEALAARYREVLLRATRDGFAPVLPELLETELSATTARRGGELKALREVERGVVDALAGGGDSLLPIAYLHYLADAEYLRRDQTWMAAQNRLWIDQLVERWLSRQRDAGTRRVAAQLLAALGSSRQALQLDPDNELALLRQAMSAEKGGQLEGAAALLQQLVGAHPESAHGRLRLGVVLRRMGRTADATRTLQPLTTPAAAPRWIAGLAYQELAAIEHAAGRRDRAEEVLRQGIERVGIQGLYVQLAFYLDERHRPDDAVAVMNSMPLEGDVESSGRHLYNGLPFAEIAAARQEVEARLDAGVSPLRLALGGTAPGHEGSR